MAFIGIVVFLMVWAYSFWQSRDIVQSLLAGINPGDVYFTRRNPGCFYHFYGIGFLKLMKQSVIIKRSSIVETLEVQL